MSENLPDQCRTRLEQGITQLSIQLQETQVSQLLDYVALLCKWNKAYNLTAIRDPEQMIIRHLLDSLAILPYLQTRRILDVGTGAGIPGLIIAICQQDTEVTLLDSNGKKTRFLQYATTQLSLDNVEVVQSRAEDYSPVELFDRIVSRAFTALDKMVHWCHPLLAEEGVFLAMKGAYPEPNQKDLPSGWLVTHVEPLVIPFITEQRHLVSVARTNH